MDRSGLFTISEFARISGISRDNLIFYDRIGVLKPEKVDYNGYRYYSIRQIWLVYFVMMFKEFGMPLEKIKKISRDRTPERILQVFSNQKEVIGREIRKLQQRLLMIEAQEEVIRETEGLDENAIHIQDRPAEPVLRGPVIRDFRQEKLNTYFSEFFSQCLASGIGLGFPLGCEVTKKSLLRKEWGHLHRIYFRVPQAKQKKKAGKYVVGYVRGDYFTNFHLYERMMEFIADNGFVVNGAAYEEYMLDEVTTIDPSEYLMRLSIPVRETSSDPPAAQGGGGRSGH